MSLCYYMTCYTRCIVATISGHINNTKFYKGFKLKPYEWHVCWSFCYADEVTLLARTGMALNAMLDTCTGFADAHNLSFNSSKTKCKFIDRSCLQLHCNVRFMGRSVEFVNSVDLLGVPLYADFF